MHTVCVTISSCELGRRDGGGEEGEGERGYVHNVLSLKYTEQKWERKQECGLKCYKALQLAIAVSVFKRFTQKLSTSLPPSHNLAN